MIFKTAHNLTTRTRQVFKHQNVRKTNKTFDLLGFSLPFFKKNWITHQPYGDRAIENYGPVSGIGETVPISSFNLMDENDMTKCFSWIKLRSMYFSGNTCQKKTKINHRLYHTQETRANLFFFSK